MRVLIGVLVLFLLASFLLVGCGSKEEQAEPQTQEQPAAMEKMADTTSMMGDTMHQMQDTTGMDESTEMNKEGGE